MKRALLIVFLATACGPSDVDAPALPQEPPAPPQQQQQPVHTSLPCDVRAALQASCAGCHVGAVYIPAFSTRDDLLSLRATLVERMQSPTSPMPPPGAQRPLSDAERALITDWVQRGLPAGECGALE